MRAAESVPSPIASEPPVSFPPSLAKIACRRYQESMNPTRLSLVVWSGSFLALTLLATRASADDPLVDVTRKIAAETTTNGKAYANLRELTTIGPRLSGSEGAAKAIAWGKQKLESYGLDRVVLQPAMVPHWTRGDREEATIVSANKSTP